MPDDKSGPAAVPDTKSDGNWTIDVQRGLAWTIIIIFSLLILIMAARVIISGAPTDSLELLKQLTATLINIAMAVVGYFFGSSKSSQSKDETQNKIIEKLTPAPGGTESTAKAAAEAAAPPAAAVAAPPAAEAAAPAAAKEAVAEALNEAHNQEKTP